MNKTNIVITALIFLVVIIFTVLIVTMSYDSESDFVGDIVEESDLFMIKVEEVLHFDGEYDSCILISSSIEFQDLDVEFDYVSIVCSYKGYLIFGNKGKMYITNDSYVIVGSSEIDDRAGLGGVL